VRHCHTLNNTVVTTPRVLISLLEVHQLADGTIRVPEALRPYLDDREILSP
jgi:seryl-tRNA synthetase